MISTKMITDRVKEILAGLYPASTFYDHSVPASIERPSFNVYLEADRSEDGSQMSTTETTSVGIVYFSPLTGPIPEELKPLAVYSNIKEYFRRGNIRVGDRSLKIVLLRGGRQDNEIFLIAKLVYADDRPQYLNGLPQEEPAYDFMGDVNISTKNNNI